MSTPPAKKFTREAEQTRGADELRSFQYFTPAKRRASLYEDVTCDTQPSPHRHMQRDWLVSFEDGRGTWDDRSTAIRCSDWYAFRDPGAKWERTFYQVGTNYEKQIEGAVGGAASDRLFEDFHPEWVEFLRTNLQIPAYVEQGLWLNTAVIARDCLSDSIAHAVTFQASLKQRLAQAIVLYGMDLEPHFGDFSIDAAQERFLTDPIWQPTRRLLERMRATQDWMEVLVAANLCFDPTIGVFLRRELGIRAASANGDTVTPSIARTGQLEWDWIADWTASLIGQLLADEEHGAHNATTIQGWLADWLPQAREALEALAAGYADELPGSLDLEEAVAHVVRDAASFHERCGVADLVPAEVAS